MVKLAACEELRLEVAADSSCSVQVGAFPGGPRRAAPLTAACRAAGGRNGGDLRLRDAPAQGVCHQGRDAGGVLVERVHAAGQGHAVAQVQGQRRGNDRDCAPARAAGAPARHRTRRAHGQPGLCRVWPPRRGRRRHRQRQVHAVPHAGAVRRAPRPPASVARRRRRPALRLCPGHHHRRARGPVVPGAHRAAGARSAAYLLLRPLHARRRPGAVPPLRLQPGRGRRQAHAEQRRE